MVDSKISALTHEHQSNNKTQLLEAKQLNKIEFERKSRKKKLNKIFTIASGSLLCISFGTMLGWPSPTYPILLAENSTIPINLDQTAMVAGMLMNGFVIATPLSCYNCIGYRATSIISSITILTGWIVLAGSKDVIALCISRILVGSGTGYFIGKYKNQLKQVCKPFEVTVHKNLTTLLISFGICITFGIGPILTFRTLPIAGTTLPAAACIASLMLNERKYPENSESNPSVVIGDKKQRNRWRIMLLVFWLVILQQFSGSPPLIVYSQIIFTELSCAYPKICAGIYSLVFLFSTFIGLQYVPNYSCKKMLIFSYGATAILSTFHACYLYFEMSTNFSWLPLVTVQLFCFVHTAGVAGAIGQVLKLLFPNGQSRFVENFVLMCTAGLAVIVTKVFQVLYEQCGMHVSFCMLAATSVTGLITVVVCIKEAKINNEPTLKY